MLCRPSIFLVNIYGPLSHLQIGIVHHLSIPLEFAHARTPRAFTPCALLPTFPASANPKFSAISSSRHPAPHAQKGTTARRPAQRKFRNVTRGDGCDITNSGYSPSKQTHIILYLGKELIRIRKYQKAYYHGGKNDNIQACCVGRRWGRKGMSNCSPLVPLWIVKCSILCSGDF